MKSYYHSTFLIILFASFTWTLIAQTTPAPILEPAMLHFQGELPTGVPVEVTVDTTKPQQTYQTPQNPGSATPVTLPDGTTVYRIPFRRAGSSPPPPPTPAPPVVVANVISVARAASGYRVEYQVRCAIPMLPTTIGDSKLYNGFDLVSAKGSVLLQPGVPVKLADGQGMTLILTLTL